MGLVDRLRLMEIKEGQTADIDSVKKQLGL